MVPITHSRGTPTHYSNRFPSLSVNIYRFFKNVFVNCSFPQTARLWNFWSTESFSLTYDLNDFKYKFNRHFSSLGSC